MDGGFLRFMERDTDLNNAKSTMNFSSRLQPHARHLAALFCLPLIFQSASAAESADTYHMVRQGDTLEQIAEQYLDDASKWKVLQKINAIDNVYRLMPGTRIRIPLSEANRVKLASFVGMTQVCDAVEKCRLANAGEYLRKGSTVETGSDSSALLIFPNRSRLVLTENTQVRLDRLGKESAKTEVRLERGKVGIDAPSKPGRNIDLRIDTPSAHTMVRGTKFRVAVSEDKVTREETLQGLVAVNGKNRAVLVAKNRGTVVTPDKQPIAPKLLLPAPPTTGMATRFERFPIRFSLPEMPGSQQWVGAVTRDAAREQILLEREVPASAGSIAFADLPNGSYFLHLRAVDTVGLSGQDAIHRFEVFARPFAPIPTNPGDHSKTRATNPTFSWSEVVGTSKYRIQVADREDFAATRFDLIVDATSWQAPEFLQAMQPYWWRIASIDDEGVQGPWSDAASFKYAPTPGAVEAGRVSVEMLPKKIAIRLPPPPEGLGYRAKLSSEATMDKDLVVVDSENDAIDLPRPGTGDYYLSLQYVDTSDGTTGPAAVNKLVVPSNFNEAFLLLIPLFLL